MTGQPDGQPDDEADRRAQPTGPIDGRIRHFLDVIAGRPTLVPGPIPVGRPTDPEEALPVTVALQWTDGHIEAGTGWAKAWTPDAVLVDVQTSRGHYWSWVHPAQVRRRPIPGA